MNNPLLEKGDSLTDNDLEALRQAYRQVRERLPEEERDLRAIRRAFKQIREANRRISELDETSKKQANISANHRRYQWQEGEK